MSYADSNSLFGGSDGSDLFGDDPPQGDGEELLSAFEDDSPLTPDDVVGHDAFADAHHHQKGPSGPAIFQHNGSMFKLSLPAPPPQVQPEVTPSLEASSPQIPLHSGTAEAVAHQSFQVSQDNEPQDNTHLLASTQLPHDPDEDLTGILAELDTFPKEELLAAVAEVSTEGRDANGGISRDDQAGPVNYIAQQPPQVITIDDNESDDDNIVIISSRSLPQVPLPATDQQGDSFATTSIALPQAPVQQPLAPVQYQQLIPNPRVPTPGAFQTDMHYYCDEIPPGTIVSRRVDIEGQRLDSLMPLVRLAKRRKLDEFVQTMCIPPDRRAQFLSHAKSFVIAHAMRGPMEGELDWKARLVPLALRLLRDEGFGPAFFHEGFQGATSGRIWPEDSTALVFLTYPLLHRLAMNERQRRYQHKTRPRKSGQFGDYQSRPSTPGETPEISACFSGSQPRPAPPPLANLAPTIPSPFLAVYTSSRPSPAPSTPAPTLSTPALTMNTAVPTLVPQATSLMATSITNPLGTIKGTPTSVAVSPGGINPTTRARDDQPVPNNIAVPDIENSPVDTPSQGPVQAATIAHDPLVTQASAAVPAISTTTPSVETGTKRKRTPSDDGHDDRSNSDDPTSQPGRTLRLPAHANLSFVVGFKENGEPSEDFPKLTFPSINGARSVAGVYQALLNIVGANRWVETIEVLSSTGFQAVDSREDWMAKICELWNDKIVSVMTRVSISSTGRQDGAS